VDCLGTDPPPETPWFAGHLLGHVQETSGNHVLREENI
jgi:hypothetical protein